LYFSLWPSIRAKLPPSAPGKTVYRLRFVSPRSIVFLLFLSVLSGACLKIAHSSHAWLALSWLAL
jgi:hypothetical protein